MGKKYLDIIGMCIILNLVALFSYYESLDGCQAFSQQSDGSSRAKKKRKPCYGRVKALRVLIYARLKGLNNDTRVVEHLKKQPWIAKTLGLQAVPDRTTVGRWWRRYLAF